MLARLGAFGSALLARPADAAQPPTRLAMGLIPCLSTRTLISVFDPLRKHLERELALPVMSFTATSHRAFAEGLGDGAYDFAFMPAHTMRMAMQDRGFVPLARSPLEPIDLRDLEALDRYAARLRRLLALR